MAAPLGFVSGSIPDGSNTQGSAQTRLLGLPVTKPLTTLPKDDSGGDGDGTDSGGSGNGTDPNFIHPECCAGPVQGACCGNAPGCNSP